MNRVESWLDWDCVENALCQALGQHPQRQALRDLLAGQALILVRNWYGRLMLLLPCARAEFGRSGCAGLIAQLQTAAGPLALSPWVLCRDELHDAASYWADPALLCLFSEPHAPGKPLALQLLERQDRERDWLTPAARRATGAAGAPRRCVFFSVKGGVGRSAALTMLAIALARRGKRVLVVDGDFESPGLSSSLLPGGAGQATYGVVDWLTAQALGADSAALEHLALEQAVAPSPLTARLGLAGELLVAPAYGQRTQAYVAKLARMYRQGQDGQTYAQRLNDFLHTAQAQHRIDITLFDCRAGIDDTAAVALTQLQAELSLLFAIDTRQTWDAYRLLLRHLRRNRALFARAAPADDEDEAWDLRRSLRLVAALTPQEHGPYLGYLDRLQQNAYDCFAEIYDEDPDADRQAFAPAPGDSDAPHAALRIQWVDALRAFNPVSEPEQLTDPLNQAAFADFLSRATALLGAGDDS